MDAESGTQAGGGGLRGGGRPRTDTGPQFYLTASDKHPVKNAELLSSKCISNSYLCSGVLLPSSVSKRQCVRFLLHLSRTDFMFLQDSASLSVLMISLLNQPWLAPLP